jgi:hypothetical protein
MTKFTIKPIHCYKDDFNKILEILLQSRKVPYVHVPLTIIVVVGLILLNPIAFVPDFWNLSEAEKAHDALGTVISSIPEIIGVVIAVILLAFEFFRQEVGEAALGYFIKNRNLAYLISLSLSCILCGFFTKISLSDEFLSNRQTTVVYFNICLWVSTLISLFPLTFRIISSLQIEKIIQAELSRIHVNIPSIRYQGEDDNYSYVEGLKKDPIIILQGIATKGIHKGDKFSPSLITIGLSQKMALLMVDNEHHQYYCIERLSRYFETFVSEAWESPNYHRYLNSVWDSIIFINENFARQNKKLLSLRELNVAFVEKNFEDLLSQNKLQGIEGLIKAKYEIIKILVENSGDEKNLSTLSLIYNKEYVALYGKRDFTAFPNQGDVIFDEVQMHLLPSYYKLCEIVIEYNHRKAFDMLAKSVSRLPWIIKINDNQPLKKAYLAIANSNYQGLTTPWAFTSGLFKKSSEANYILPFEFEMMLRAREFYCRLLLVGYCGWAIWMQSDGFLDESILGAGRYSRSELSRLLFICTRYINDWEELDSSIEKIVLTIETIVKNIQNKDLNDIALLERIKIELESNIKEMKNQNNLLLQKHIGKLESITASIVVNLSKPKTPNRRKKK